MEELSKKLKGLLKKDQRPGNFKGQGHRLGTAEPSAAAAAQQRPSGSKGPHGARAAAPPSAIVDPGQELKPATEFSPFTAVIGGGAARTTNQMITGDTTTGNAASSSYAGRQQQQQQQSPQVQRAAVGAAVLEELQHCLALIVSQPSVAASSMEVLSKLLSNLLGAPQEAKYRQLRLAPKPAPKIQAHVLDVPGALDFLKACGFEVHTDEQSEAGPESCAYFLDDAKLSHVEAALMQLQTAMAQQQQQQQQQSAGPSQLSTAPGPAAAAGAGSVPTSPQGVASSSSAATAATTAATAAAAATSASVVNRNTLVLLPAAPDTDVPEWFFQRTAAEVKAEFMSLLRQRQTREVFASKAWKDLKLGANSSSGGRSSAVTLRVRFPEGVCLQGCFGRTEPVTAVFDFVTSSLRMPGITYELITPSRRPLGTTGSVGSADLAGAVLNFRGLSHTQQGYLVDQKGRQLPFLSDALLAQAKAD